MRIADGGPGIPEGERLTVSGRGVRGSTSAGTSGSGLGLNVASRLMADMGGTLHLADPGDPAGGPGACFVLELPAARSDQRVREPSAPRGLVSPFHQN